MPSPPPPSTGATRCWSPPTPPSAAGAEAQQPEDGTDAETSAGGGDAETAGDESSQYVSVQVTTGISDDSYIEITSGLQEGDTVVYIPTTSSDSDMGMMGGMPGGGGGMPGGGGGGMGGGPGASEMKALIEFKDVCKYYYMGDTVVKAADRISFQIYKGSSWPSSENPAPERARCFI